MKTQIRLGGIQKPHSSQGGGGQIIQTIESCQLLQNEKNTGREGVKNLQNRTTQFLNAPLGESFKI